MKKVEKADNPRIIDEKGLDEMIGNEHTLERVSLFLRQAENNIQVDLPTRTRRGR